MSKRFLAYLALILLTVPAAPVLASGDERADVDWNEMIQKLSFLGSPRTEDYILGPGDLIQITVFDVDRFNQTVRISSSGQISMPFLGKMEASGLTGAELEEKITAQMTERRLIRDPQVSVFIQEYRSQPVYVLGAVNSPGQYMLSQPLGLIDVLSMAGGLNLAYAADHAVFQRRVTDAEAPSAAQLMASLGNESNDSPPGSVTVEINLRELLERGNLALNVPVRGGDVIHVPEREIELIYIIGEVHRPGVYELPEDQEQILMSQALAWAGGHQRTARLGGGMLIRYDEEGNRQEVEVDIGSILNGSKPDILVRKEDVIFIPGSNFRTIGYGLLGVIPGTVSGTAVYGARGAAGMRRVR